jgi:CRISPR-associated protein Csm3
MSKEIITLKADLVCESGLHLGNKEGGYAPRSLNAPVLQNPVLQINDNFAPYISASAFKGKLRNIAEILFEMKMNFKFDERDADPMAGTPRLELWRHECEKDDDARQCRICSLFGTRGLGDISLGTANVAGKVLIRNAKLKAPVVPELKTENTLKRLRREANPRTIERVPPATVFDFELVYFAGDGADSQKWKARHLADLVACLRFLETNHLGGNGSRGYGKIKFTNLVFDGKPQPSLEVLHRTLLAAPEVSDAK